MKGEDIAIATLPQEDITSLPKGITIEPISNYFNNHVKPGLMLEADKLDPNMNSWIIGPGIIHLDNRLAVQESQSLKPIILIKIFGILRYKKLTEDDKVKHKLWIESFLPPSPHMGMARCNFPRRFHVNQFEKRDKVIGVCVKKSSQYFHIDIGCASTATLNVYSFEGAGKKKTPDVRVGDVVYAAVLVADMDLEIELTCVDEETGTSNGLGIIGRNEPGAVGFAGSEEGGVLLSCTPELIGLLSNGEGDFPFLAELSKRYPFEIYLGCNGMIWLFGRTPKEIQLLSNAIFLADKMNKKDALLTAKYLD